MKGEHFKIPTFSIRRTRAQDEVFLRQIFHGHGRFSETLLREKGRIGKHHVILFIKFPGNVQRGFVVVKHKLGAKLLEAFVILEKGNWKHEVNYCSTSEVCGTTNLLWTFVSGKFFFRAMYRVGEEMQAIRLGFLSSSPLSSQSLRHSVANAMAVSSSYQNWLSCQSSSKLSLEKSRVSARSAADVDS